MGQGHLRVIIYINFAELEYIMLYAKFHNHRTISSVGEEFTNILEYIHKELVMPQTNDPDIICMLIKVRPQTESVCQQTV